MAPIETRHVSSKLKTSVSSVWPFAAPLVKTSGSRSILLHSVHVASARSSHWELSLWTALKESVAGVLRSSLTFPLRGANAGDEKLVSPSSF